MSKLEKYYQVMPENFNDDLADSLMKAFSSLEGVDVIDEIPALKNELWQRDYLIAPRPEQIIERKDMWFVKVDIYSSADDLYQVIEKIFGYNHTIINNPFELFHSIRTVLSEIDIPNLKTDTSFEEMKYTYSIRTESSTIRIDCYQLK